jgi:hypothetical protein
MNKWSKEIAFKVNQAKININLLHKVINLILRFKRKIQIYKTPNLKHNKILQLISVSIKNYCILRSQIDRNL